MISGADEHGRQREARRVTKKVQDQRKRTIQWSKQGFPE